MSKIVLPSLPSVQIPEAVYRDTVIDRFKGNPLIEALPALLTDEGYIQHATSLPPIQDFHYLSARERITLLHTVRECFVPLSHNFELEQALSNALRWGYANRNPIEKGYWKRVDQIVDKVRSAIVSGRPTTNFVPEFASTLGFLLMGVSGVGKTWGVNSVLSQYPQVIHHSRYIATKWSNYQIVWLKVECPKDGSIKQLGSGILRAVDRLLETNYYHTYGDDGKRSAEDVMPYIAHLAMVHNIGSLVIDEIQNLSEAASGGAAKMLNFFVELVNTVQMPVVLIGTPKAKKFLSSEFRQVRRGSGQGEFIWNGLQFDDDWHNLIDTIWRYQYLIQPTPLNHELSQALHYESAGVTDIAIKLFILAQWRAIGLEDEVITPERIREVARDSLPNHQPMLKALRDRDMIALSRFSDVEPISLDARFAQLPPILGNPRLSTNNIPANQRVLVPSNIKSKSDQTKFIARSSALIEVVKGKKAAKGKRLAPYDALKEAGWIRNAGEFTNEF